MILHARTLFEGRWILFWVVCLAAIHWLASEGGGYDHKVAPRITSVIIPLTINVIFIAMRGK